MTLNHRFGAVTKDTIILQCVFILFCQIVHTAHPWCSSSPDAVMQWSHGTTKSVFEICRESNLFPWIQLWLLGRPKSHSVPGFPPKDWILFSVIVFRVSVYKYFLKPWQKNVVYWTISDLCYHINNLLVVVERKNSSHTHLPLHFGHSHSLHLLCTTWLTGPSTICIPPKTGPLLTP